VLLELSYQRRRRVFALNCAPWISKKTFSKAYRKCQKVVWGGNNRRMKVRTLAVMRFVTEHPYEEGERLRSWSQPIDLWNDEHPAVWSFMGRSGLRRVYPRAAEGLVAVPGADIRFGVLRLGGERADLGPCGGGKDAVGAFCDEARWIRSALAVYETGSLLVRKWLVGALRLLARLL
jgi:hypothetical protein